MASQFRFLLQHQLWATLALLIVLLDCRCSYAYQEDTALLNGEWRVKTELSLDLNQDESLTTPEEKQRFADTLREAFGHLRFLFRKKTAKNEYEFLIRSRMGKFWYEGKAWIKAGDAGNEFVVDFEEDTEVHLSPIIVTKINDETLSIDSWSGYTVVIEKLGNEQEFNGQMKFDGIWRFEEISTQKHIDQFWPSVWNTQYPAKEIIESASDSKVKIEQEKVVIANQNVTHTLTIDFFTKNGDSTSLSTKLDNGERGPFLLIDESTENPTMILEAADIIPLIYRLR